MNAYYTAVCRFEWYCTIYRTSSGHFEALAGQTLRSRTQMADWPSSIYVFRYIHGILIATSNSCQWVQHSLSLIEILGWSNDVGLSMSNDLLGISRGHWQLRHQYKEQSLWKTCCFDIVDHNVCVVPGFNLSYDVAGQREWFHRYVRDLYNYYLYICGERVYSTIPNELYIVLWGEGRVVAFNNAPSIPKMHGIVIFESTACEWSDSRWCVRPGSQGLWFDQVLQLFTRTVFSRWLIPYT